MTATPTLEEAKHPSRRRRPSPVWYLRIGMGAMLIALPAILTDAYYLDIVVQVYLWWAIAGAWNILGGYGGQFSIGHGGFFAIGAYGSVILAQDAGLSPWIGMWIGATVAALIAVILGAVTLRLRGPFFALLTLAFGEIVHLVATDWRWLTQGADGLLLDAAPNPAQLVFPNARGYAYVSLVLAVAIYLGSLMLQNSRYGYQFHALRENEDAARAVGVQALRLRLASLAASAALTAVGGSIFAAYLGYIDPDSVAGIDVSIRIALIGIVGGVALARGPLVGSVIVIVLTTVLRDELGTYLENGYLAVFGLILVVIVLAVPGGVASVLRVPGRLRSWGSADA